MRRYRPSAGPSDNAAIPRGAGMLGTRGVEHSGFAVPYAAPATKAVTT